MPLLYLPALRPVLARMQVRRGLRAGLAVAVAMAACRLLHRPAGWAAIGALYVSTVDNGGPVRSRLNTMFTVLVPGSLAVLLGAFAGIHLTVALAVTFALCFAVTMARVIAQPIAATSVFILICYVVAYGHPDHSLAAGLGSMAAYLAGGLWSASLAFVLWPLDPFLPARQAVAELYATLGRLAGALPGATGPGGPHRFNDLVAQTRVRIEAAHATLAATPARLTARTVRARSLSVLVESADLIFARVLRIADLGRQSTPALTAIDTWLQASLLPLERALTDRPHDRARAFAPEGSLSLDLHRAELRLEATLQADAALDPGTRTYLAATLRDTLFNLEVCHEALRAVWTGAESRQTAAFAAAEPRASTLWLDALRANFTLRSVMFRFALRVAAVVTLDILLLRLIHTSHNYWMPMTSLIVLRPYAGETVKRSVDRVLGTVLGGLLAALLTAILPSQAGLLLVIVVGTTLSVALYSVDYAWYCFFLTPTIVLLTLPHLHDWHLAAIRAGFTGLGALIAVLAMLLLWPERESLQLPGLLARAADADADYLRAMLRYWQHSGGAVPDSLTVKSGGQDAPRRIDAERAFLAPARRRCGLAVNDAEETLDHALLEHSIPLNPRRDQTQRLNSAALTFTTYLRRITRTTTTLAAIGPGDEPLNTLIDTLATRLQAVSNRLTDTPGAQVAAHLNTGAPGLDSEMSTKLPPLLADQLRRLDRQISVLESTSSELTMR